MGAAAGTLASARLIYANQPLGVLTVYADTARSWGDREAALLRGLAHQAAQAIVNARLFYCDLAEMLAADDGVRTTQAAIHELQVVHDNPLDAPDLGPLPRRLWDAVAMTYTNRGGLPGAQRLPGGSSDYTTWTNDVEGVAYGKGRADIRLAVDGDGELYVLSKSDGAIRKFAAALSPPLLQGSASNGVGQLQWTSVPGRTYRVQSKAALTDASWSDVPGDVVATGISSTATNVPANARFYRVVESPSP